MSMQNKLDHNAIKIDLKQQVYVKTWRRLIPLLLLCFISIYLDRVNVSFAKLQMLTDLKFSETIYGFGAGIFFMGYFIFEIPSNIILSQIGARIWIACLLILCGIISGTTIFVTSPHDFYIMRFLLGIVEAGFFPGIMLYVTYWFPKTHYGRIYATIMSAIPLAGIFGSPLAGWILNCTNNILNLRAWQWLLLIEAILSLVLGGFALLYLEHDIKMAKWLNNEEKLILEYNIKRDVVNEELKPNLFIDGISNPKIWQISLIYFCFCSGVIGINFWLPTIIKTSGIINSFIIGMIIAIISLLSIIAMLLIGKISDIHNKKRYLLIAILAFLVFIALLITAVWLNSNITITIVALTVTIIGLTSIIPIFWSYTIAYLGTTSNIVGIALINAVGNLAGFIVPYWFGFLEDKTHTLKYSIYFLDMFVFLGAISILVFQFSIKTQSNAK